MSAKRPIVFDPNVRPVYTHLEPIVDVLLASGNQLAHPYRWGENRTGAFCHLTELLDYDLIARTFELPAYVRFVPETNSIECDQSWATITGGMVHRVV